MSTKKLLFNMIVAFIIGFLVTKIASNYMIINTTITPWILVTLLFFPATFSVQAMLKLPESSEHTELTSSEIRRLKGIVDAKQNRLYALICFYFVSAIIFVVLFLLQQQFISMNIIISICFGLIFSSLSTLIYIRSIMHEIQSFKNLMIHRADKKKKKEELLNKLKSDD
ncbi:hypothetical protein V5094_05360 [Moellerella wisconsensis]|uniref:hypothetical protein n=1 Tax=Moellerella wisconsensis TaxID=158849 RepID=UPI0030761CB0